MKVQKPLREVPQDPKKLEPFLDWQELSPSFETLSFGDCTLLIATIEDEEFDKLLHIFQSREEAMGAFLSVAMEHGWEEVPQTYCIYHAQEVDGKLIAGVKLKDQVSFYEQTTVEQLAQILAKVHRVVVYSSEVLTYIKDIYPDIDHKTYSIAREIAKRLGKAPEFEDLGKIYGMPFESLEEKLNLIERLLENPVRTPYGEVELPPYSYPLVGCE